MFARSMFVALLAVPCLANGQGYGGYVQHHSSTAEEGAQRGYADVVRSYGMANLLNAQAANQIEDARKQYIENRIKATQGYFELRSYVAESRNSLRRPLSLEQYVRLAQVEAPQPLRATQLDPLTGMINWPAPLRKPEYEAFRQRIDRLLQDWAKGYAVYGELPVACQEWAEQLQVDIMKFPPDDYIAAKKFLDSLAWSTRNAQG